MEKKRSQIRSEIKTLIHDFKQDAQTLSAKIIFPANFTGFSGHFPGEPILPGICQIQCILELLSASLTAEVNLLSVDRAKFLNIVTPNEEIFITGSFERNNNKVSGSFKITKRSDSPEENKEISVSRLKIVGIFDA